jgi:hypothetical protein
MDCAIQHRYSTYHLRQLNMCKIYLQVITLSDITSANDKIILQGSLFGDKEFDRPSTLLWPFQPCLPESAWNTWRIFLQHFHVNGRLKEPLGQWLHQPHQQWKWYTTADSTQVYKYKPETNECVTFQPILPPMTCHNLRSFRPW